jgi:hypothetical protein
VVAAAVAPLHTYVTRPETSGGSTMVDTIPEDLSKQIEEFSEKGWEIIRPFFDKLEKRPVPSIIYHYTDDDGLHGILKAGNLRFTDIFYLNDPSELRHGINYAIKFLREKAENGSDAMKSFSNHFKDLVEARIEAVAHHFVCCFSAERDELGQWRAYADNGHGYALGFDGPMLEEAFAKKESQPIPEHHTFPITYEEDALCEMHGEIVSAVDLLISKMSRSPALAETINDRFAKLMTAFSLPIFTSSLFFKHKAYKNEREYRFMQIHQSDKPLEHIKYLKRPYSLARFREFDWRSAAGSALREIVIGRPPTVLLPVDSPRNVCAHIINQALRLSVLRSPIEVHYHADEDVTCHDGHRGSSGTL